MIASEHAAFVGWVDLSQVEGPRLARLPSFAVAEGFTTMLARGMHVRVRSNAASVIEMDRGFAIVVGTPYLVEEVIPATVKQIGAVLAGDEAGAKLGGRFSIVHIDTHRNRVLFLNDRFAVHPVCYATEQTRISFSDRADCVPTNSEPTIDLQAVFNYLYFHVVPAPRTAFVGVARLEAARCLLFDERGVRQSATWSPNLNSAGQRPPSADEFRALIRSAVEREADQPATGAFLSGGTDSSTIAGMLRGRLGNSVPVFSIGFDEASYDEIEFAKVAARHFGCQHHVHYLTPEELVVSAPEIASHYDQPFGNSSAVPAYSCAKLASDQGVKKLLGGDGGDELFGGNTRYAKQKVFALYENVPHILQRQLLEPMLLRTAAKRTPGLRKLASYINQARVPFPHRAEAYNLLLRHGAGNILSSRFADCVQQQEPSTLEHEVFSATAGAGLLNRMLAYDWRFTLADNDLPKVVGTAQLAGLKVGFPFLDDRVVDMSLRLSPSQKVRGLTLRYWFKQSLTDFLPRAVIEKKKHGFGLPFGPWLVAHKQVERLARDSVDALVARGIASPLAIERLFSEELRRYPGFYGEMIWILMMLEYWLRRAAPRWTMP